MTFWVGLIIGLFVGGFFGAMAVILCVAAKNDPYKGDKYDQ